MFNDITKPPPPLPVKDLRELCPGVSLLSPLTRRGHGPGIILLVPDSDASTKIIEGVPSHLVKWAEEGYTVVEIQQQALANGAADVLKQSIHTLKNNPKCEPKDKIGVIAYDPECWNQAAKAVNDSPEVAATVVYADISQQNSIVTSNVPAIHHLAGKGSERPLRSETLTTYHYPGVASYKFAIPFQSLFHYTTEAISHTRSITHVKQRLGGPYFDLELIWEEHTYYEFADRSVEHTMSTMVQEPYVNHVPTLTGGVGRGSLTNFYRNNFIFNNSADTSLDLISRSIAIDRIIDEFIFTFTHDHELDWLLPGVPPTNLKVEVPFTAVVNVRGDRLYHEHIAWDQGTVLRQLGLLPEYLPFPYPLPEGRTPAPGKSFEYRVPVADTDTASKMRDRNSVRSNMMFGFRVREV
ncbi:hypothetical protein N0V83_005817 [Neocucurbitaria cava]|uniref:Carboxymethylenebutenolidase n=1 Tax=Neocucurbitaria cava TaxID=798079 RepID=A0A9W8Y5T7_9PLEO|nr:hypothetical protein N0V83_005817 [Neocucurbitaria cava]